MNIPNTISLIRLLLAPVMVAIFLLAPILDYAAFWAAIIFVIASLTDFVDGFLARKLNQVTSLGKFFDSICDKVLCMLCLLLIMVYSYEDVDYWFFVLSASCCAITIARDFIISALRQYLATKNIVMAADKYGKIKAIFQYVSFPLMLCYMDLAQMMNIDVAPIKIISVVLFALSVVMAIISAIHYFYVNGKHLLNND